MRGKSFDAAGSMLAVVVFAVVGLGGGWWFLGQRAPQEVQKPVAASAPKAVAAPAAEAVPTEATPVPEPVAPAIAKVPEVTPAPLVPAEVPAPPASEVQSFETRLTHEPVLTLLGTLLSDVLYLWVDPRVSYS